MDEGSVFAFRSTWRVPVDTPTLWTLVDRLLESDDPVSWWASVRTLAYDGDRLLLEADSRLGYRLRVSLVDLQVDRRKGLSFRGEGDLDSRGEVTVGGTDHASLDIVWTATPRLGWMRRRWLRPWLSLGHRIVMAQGRRRFVAWVRDVTIGHDEV